ncbi:MAG: type II toxin-antitoxin system VapC family toxin [Candidatus Omnitrophica bacterium]|nr:type II toxin-antitoxin system VapC family toxin [Candidatus Omnitrophota bacterium]
MPKSKRQEIYLLDTHMWLWLMNGDKQLKSSEVLKKLNQAADSSYIYVSVISVWEIGMLEAKKRIILPVNCYQWINQALKAPGISLMNLTPEIALDSTRLPNDFHGDPADRMIVATAKSLGATLVTQDRHIIQYLKKENIPALSI